MESKAKNPVAALSRSHGADMVHAASENTVNDWYYGYAVFRDQPCFCSVYRHFKSAALPAPRFSAVIYCHFHGRVETGLC